jgi:hypothetical protein
LTLWNDADKKELDSSVKDRNFEWEDMKLQESEEASLVDSSHKVQQRTRITVWKVLNYFF